MEQKKMCRLQRNEGINMLYNIFDMHKTYNLFVALPYCLPSMIRKLETVH